MYKSSNITQRPLRLQQSQPQPLRSSGSLEAGRAGTPLFAGTGVLSLLGAYGRKQSPSTKMALLLQGQCHGFSLWIWGTRRRGCSSEISKRRARRRGLTEFNSSSHNSLVWFGQVAESLVLMPFLLPCGTSVRTEAQTINNGGKLTLAISGQFWVGATQPALIPCITPCRRTPALALPQVPGAVSPFQVGCVRMICWEL